MDAARFTAFYELAVSTMDLRHDLGEEFAILSALFQTNRTDFRPCQRFEKSRALDFFVVEGKSELKVI
jgi:hypothetical protein